MWINNIIFRKSYIRFYVQEKLCSWNVTFHIHILNDFIVTTFGIDKWDENFGQNEIQLPTTSGMVVVISSASSEIKSLNKDLCLGQFSIWLKPDLFKILCGAMLDQLCNCCLKVFFCLLINFEKNFHLNYFWNWFVL